jgi:hypothetical protein
LAEVISRIIQAVLGDLIPLAFHRTTRGKIFRKTKKGRLMVAGGWWS